MKRIGPILIKLMLVFTWYNALGQNMPKFTDATIDSLRDSHVASIKVVGQTDTTQALVKVLVRTLRSSEPVQGATVLLRRDQDKMLGRVTKADGRCQFVPTPAEYAIRVQITGYKSLEQTGLLFEKGKVYELLLLLGPQ